MARKKSGDQNDDTTLGEAHEVDAAAALRAFEDEKLGPDTPRFEGKVERGHGSHYRRMSDEDRARHAELEQAVDGVR